MHSALRTIGRLAGRAVLATLLLVHGGVAGARAQTAAPDDARALAEEAYVFAFPMLENYKTMYVQAVDRSSKAFKAPFNRIHHSRELIGPEFRSIVRPNNDTLYSMIWLDLRAEPVVIRAPPIENRYFSLQLVDVYTHNFGYVGTRTTGSGGGAYLIAGPGWSGETPPGIDRVFKSEGSFAFCIGRTAVAGPADLPNVAAIQDRMQAVPLSAFLERPAPAGTAAAPFPAYDEKKARSAGFVAYVNFLLDGVAIDPSETALLGRFGALGIGPGRAFDPDKLDPKLRAAIDEGVASALKKIAGQADALGERKNGWTCIKRIFGDRKAMQGKYLTRAAAAFFGLYGNDLEEAYYPSTTVDAGGAPLDGAKHAYVLRFARSDMPPVDAFWSITMYGLPDQLMVANPLKRYSIGDRTPGLRFGADGSLTIHIRRDSPGPENESNWLPAPEGPFSLTMRMYLPKPGALEPLYAPPPIKPAE